MKHKIDLLIFDLDGTLIDSRQDLANAINHARKEYSLPPLDMDSVAKHIGHGAKNLVNQTVPGLKPMELDRAINIFKSYYQVHCTDETRVYDGVRDVLKYFQSKSMAVVSNKPVQFTNKILKETELHSYFRLILGEESHPKKKPDPAPLQYVLEQLNMKSERSAMIGDWTTDIEAGKKAGMITVGCLYGIGQKDEIIQIQPDYMVDSIIEIKDLFK